MESGLHSILAPSDLYYLPYRYKSPVCFSVPFNCLIIKNDASLSGSQCVDGKINTEEIIQSKGTG